MQNHEAEKSIISERNLPVVLVVDDEPSNLRIMEELLMANDFEILTASDGTKAVRIADSRKIDVMVCDIKMDGMDGHAVLRHMVAHHPLVPVIMLTGFIDLNNAIEVMREGARDYITKPISAKRLIDSVVRAYQWRQRALAKHKQQQQIMVYQKELERKVESAELKVQKAMLDVVRALSNAMAARSSHLMDHARRVARLTSLFAREIGLESDKSRLLQQAATLHDIGKIALADAIVAKTELFSGDEERSWRRHVEYGVKILEPILYMKPILPAIKHHHERWDGTGFPDGLAGEDIPIPARMIAIADAYDNMTTERDYRKALSPTEAVEELSRSSGTRFDPNLLERFFVVISRITKT